MKFKKLVVENFKSFQFPTEITFPGSGTSNTIFLVGGMNGAGKTTLKEAIDYCLYGAKQDEIYKNINRKEKSRGNFYVSFELTMELDDLSELMVKRAWTAGVIDDPKPKDLSEQLVVVRDGKRVSVQNKQMFQDYIQATIPQSITQFFFFDGEKIQEIASDDHSEVRLKTSLEAVLGIQYISRLAGDIMYLKQEERKGFVPIEDEDIEYKQSELKRERSKLNKKKVERDELKLDLEELTAMFEDNKKRFQLTFNIEPETKDSQREAEKKRIQTANRLGQLDNEIKGLCEKYLPFGILGSFFEGIKNQINLERESQQKEVIKESASDLAKRIVRVVEEPVPIYNEKLTNEKMEELEKRIFKLLKEGTSLPDVVKILDLSERDSARVLHYIESIESSEVFMLQPLIEEKAELESKLKEIERTLNSSIASESEKQLFQQLQDDMEGYSVQIGRKTEQLRILEEDIITIERHISDIEAEIDKLYEKHNTSKEKADFISECDAIAGLLNQFIVRLRKNKVHLLQEKTFEMYKNLSSKSGLIKDIVIEDKTYEIKIIDRSGHEIKKSSLSAGEKEVFAISLLWGLAQTSELKLPIIIDTPLSRLDSTHRDNIVNKYFPHAAEQVIILSTDTEIDKDYYRALSPYLSGAARLMFDQRQELTTVQMGYFWEG